MQDEVQSKALKRAIRRVTEYLADQIAPVTGKHIAEAINSRTQDIYEALNWLRSNGRIQASGDGVKGDPVLYRLTTKRMPIVQKPVTAMIECNINQPEFEEFVI